MKQSIRLWRSAKYYPLQNLDILYSRDVEFYRYGINNNYKIMNHIINIDMIASAAIMFPKLTNDYQSLSDKNDIELMKNKIRMLLKVGIKEENNVIILSAWGCGAFGCPPLHIAKLFKEIIENEFINSYQVIIFGIQGNNYEVFKNIIG